MAMIIFLSPILLFPLALQEPASYLAQNDDEDAGHAPIVNPYFDKTEWRVWRDDDTPIESIPSMARVDKQEKKVDVTLAALEKAERSYPVDAKGSGLDEPYAIYLKSAKPSSQYAGIWDDVYASWSGLHGYVRSNWRGTDGSKAIVLDQIIHFVDGGGANTLRAGVNFIHQSTTGMAHTITNGYSLPMTTRYEKLYFSGCLVTSPAHNSFTDLKSARSSDLYIAHVPTLFNSVGSSNSETMAITKMILVGGYLPPATKLLLKRNGLYPAALLYIWKASLPYDEPYDHELRHRIAYKSIGNRATYPEKYSAAGINKGDAALAFHQYDDLTHMRAMIDLARSMDVAPPEAIFDVTKGEAGSLRYALKKSAVILQEEGEDVELSVSTAGCYDLQGLPLTTRWKLLYGNKETSIEAEPGDPTSFTIRVPWDDALPEGRTAIALIANNGRFDSNPAILTIYRKKSDLPPIGQTPADYNFPLTFSNLRPLLLDLQDQSVRPGRELSVSLNAIDPEGFPLTFHKRTGEVGELDGNIFTWQCPRKAEPGPYTITIIASDGTSGNSYAGGQFNVHVGKAPVMARITADKLSGAAPLEINFSGKDSPGRSSRTSFGWSILPADSTKDAAPFEEQKSGRELTHTFDQAGLYTVRLTMRDTKGVDHTESVSVWVTAGKPEVSQLPLLIEGNGVYLPSAADVPNTFDHTGFGQVAVGKSLEQSYRIANPGTLPTELERKRALTIEGEHAKDFKIMRKPRLALAGGESTTFSIRFKPKELGTRTALIRIGSDAQRIEFTIAGTGVKATR